MLVIRLTRFGKKKKPFYRIVVAEDSAPIQGKYIEKIGHYNPLQNPPEIFVVKEKAEKWLKQGAKPSDTVWNLLVIAGVLKKKLVTQRKKQKKEKENQKKPAKPSPEETMKKEDQTPPEKSVEPEEQKEEKTDKEAGSEEGRSAGQGQITS